MYPSIRRLSRSAVPLLLAIVLAAAGTAHGPHAGAAVPAPPSTGNLEVRILAEGKPVHGVPVQARAVGETGRDTWGEGTNAAVDTSDARGVVNIRGLAVGG
jgi:hypothetical protein